MGKNPSPRLTTQTTIVLRNAWTVYMTSTPNANEAAHHSSKKTISSITTTTCAIRMRTARSLATSTATTPTTTKKIST